MASTAKRVCPVTRPAEAADSEQMAEMARDAYGKYLDLVDEPPAPILLDYEKVAASGRSHVALIDGHIHGMVTVESDDTYLILRNLAVRTTSQGRGVGKFLVAFVEEMARSAGLRGVRLWTRAEMTDNIAFYKRLDYVLTHSERNEGSHRVFFCKEFS
ncbi:GNAT family N-acetyltransferase [Streptomyces sp. NPDC127066]|uniref:GNAT family N-acetyltransferase n=1 Tax=Streptomyces sp. NPDC127066 TaxID=3347125 RepID=UPI003657AD80